MWSFMDQGPATAVLDFTSDFSMMFIWLIGVVGLSAAMILWAAIEYSRTKTRQPTVQTTSVTSDQQYAA
jgi:hypothetical protein